MEAVLSRANPDLPAHALLSASGSHKWMHCPPSMRMEQKYPERTSEYAQEGSLAHAMGARLLKSAHHLPHEDEDSEIAELKPRFYLPEMDGFTQGYADYVEQRYTAMRERHLADPGSLPPELLVETRLDYSRWVPGGFGTGDTVIVAEGELEIIDLKYGRGVRVESFKNPQMMIYALAAVTEWDWLFTPGKVTMTIYQPRLGHVSTWETTAAELLKWADTVLAPAAEEAWLGHGKTAKGSWCRFCRAKKECPEHAPDAFRNMKFEL